MNLLLNVCLIYVLFNLLTRSITCHRRTNHVRIFDSATPTSSWLTDDKSSHPTLQINWRKKEARTWQKFSKHKSTTYSARNSTATESLKTKL